MSRRALAIAVLAGLCTMRAAAADWTMLAADSRLEFVASYEGAAAPGRFRDFDARIRFDPAHVADSSIDVTIATAGADMQSADINAAIAGVDWFDTAHFPHAEFHASAVRADGPGRYVASGMLRLKGAAQPVDVPFTWTGSDATAAMRGELVVPRARFGIGSGEWAKTDVIGPDVTVKFSLALKRR
jgi:polyisoprenoid-binding protein YceI